MRQQIERPAPPARLSHVAIVSSGADRGRSASSFRAWKFARYLGASGLRVTMILPGEADAGPVQLLWDGAEVKNVAAMYAKVSQWMNKRTLPSRIFYRALFYPEPHRAWVSSFYRALVRLVSREKVDVLFVTTPKHSLQIVGIRAARRLGLPYVADLRDDWLTCSRTAWYTPLHRRCARRWEREMVDSADKVILNTSVVRDRFCARYPQRRSKLTFLTNGYDEADFAGEAVAFQVPAGRKTLMYAGAGYYGLMLEKLSALAGRMKAKGMHREWHFVTAGSEPWPPEEHKDMWSHLGLLPNEKLCPTLCRASLLLLSMPKGESCPSGTIPLKTFNYLRSARPIVYLGEPGATTALLSEFPGTFCPGREGWDTLEDWMARESAVIQGSFPRQGVREYSLEVLTGKLVAILAGAAGKRGRV